MIESGFVTINGCYRGVYQRRGKLANTHDARPGTLKEIIERETDFTYEGSK